MKILYLDCGMGAAGDMLSAALLQLHPAPETVLDKIRAMHLPDVSVALEERSTCGIRGAHYRVSVGGAEEGVSDREHHHLHVHLGDVEGILRQSGLGEAVIEDAVAVYRLLAGAEASVHGHPMEQVHFHEVGTLDAIVDVATVCLLMHELRPELICASPVHVGSGTVRCAHGELPVPAPATAQLLQGIPTYGGEIRGELCTPPGAALLRYYVNQFGKQPMMAVERIGYGVGNKEFPRANCLRALVGEAEETALELQCTVDDMSGEAVGFALGQLMAAGALDAGWQSVGMKKSRPGLLLSVLCREADREKMLEMLFRTTSTIGVRETLCRRYVLRRREETVTTAYGPVRYKVSEGYGVRRVKPEADDLAALCRERGWNLDELRRKLCEEIE